MPVIKVTRDDAIGHIADVFRRYGYDGASLSVLAEATGLGRASLYHHFPGGKEEMAREAFKAIGKQVDISMLGPLRGQGSALKRLRSWVQGVDRFYSGGGKNCLLGAMVLSGGNERFARELAGTFRALIDAVAHVLMDAGLPRGLAQGRAEGAIGQIQGSLVVSRGLGDAAPFKRMLKALPERLLENK